MKCPMASWQLVCPDGQILHHLDWRTRPPVALLKNVQRLTRANPGVMTGPGTNSYLVGDPATGCHRDRPGPGRCRPPATAVARGGRRHPLHCLHPFCILTIRPARADPQALQAATRFMPSAPTMRAASQFTPDRALSDQERLNCLEAGWTGDTPDGHPYPRTRRQTTRAWCCWKTACCSRRPCPQRQHHGGGPARRRHDRPPGVTGQAGGRPAMRMASSSSCRHGPYAGRRPRRPLSS